MEDRHQLLRLWGTVFSIVGIFALIGAVIGVVLELTHVTSVLEALAVLLIVTPIALVLATWPLAFAQLIEAIADISRDVEEIKRKQG